MKVGSTKLCLAKFEKGIYSRNAMGEGRSGQVVFLFLVEKKKCFCLHVFEPGKG